MMITLYDFIGMDDTARANAVWEGVHLGERKEGDYLIQLYSLPGFYVEVFYDTLNFKIERFRPFTKIHNLAPYLDLGPVIQQPFDNNKQMNIKRHLIVALGIVSVLALVSWGMTGHKTVGRIAQNHLTPKAQAAVQDLLGTETLADVASWADEQRNNPEYKATSSWHFLNLPLGLNFKDFEKQVMGMGDNNVYGALIKCEQELLDKTVPRAKKIDDLKFIVHFVGDLHQPMHISRAEDKGGNTIQLNYEGKGTNLHSLWDTKLLEHCGLSYEQLAEKYDHVSVKQIRQWQSDPLMKWVFESYEISSKLYAEVDAMKDRSIDDAYYQAHIGMIQQRIEMAGVRLAGVLNELFKGGPVSGGMIPPPSEIRVSASVEKVETVTVCEQVFTIRVIEGSGMTLMNLGASYPNQKYTIMISGKNRAKFKVAPEVAFKDKQVCVTGTVVDYKGKPEIVVTEPEQIVLK